MNSAAHTATATIIRNEYLALAGEIGRRVDVRELRRAVGLPLAFDAAMVALALDGAITLYPQDEGHRLTEEDHRAAVLVSGVPKHIVYWER